MQILVADDSQTNLTLITTALRKLGHQPIPVPSGEQAIEKFKQKRPDLVILDVVMGGMTGYECAKKLREIDSDDWIPIIFLSANVDDASIAQGIDAGGDDYLTKPFSEITLAAKIKAMQRISDMRQKLFETTQKLYLQSSTDALTGTFNRFQFDIILKEVLSSANRLKYTCALMFIDLDNFKNINDTFGHHVGDLLLIEVAQRLKRCVRSNDFIARIGGDEFAVILGEIKDLKTAEVIAEKIIYELSKSLDLEGHYLRAGASVGIAYYPHPGITEENLIRSADVAMYHAKSLGRNNYQLFTQDLYEKYTQQISLEHGLKFALERKEFSLVYQPIIDLVTKQVVGLETLICWDHPTLGLVSPQIFIPIAEQSGLMNAIGSWVFKTACEQASKWEINKIKNFRFSINVSSRQLMHEKFINMIEEVLSTGCFTSEKLELELTETTVMTYNTGPFKEIINKIHDMGISIAIDDFGTGYSSLARLKQLPFSTIKIDKAFTQDTIDNSNGQIIVKCIVALGKNLKLNIIAEGIETEEQLNFLTKIGCPQGQGFYLSKPLKAEQVLALLAKLKEKA